MILFLKEPQKLENTEVQQNQQQKDESLTLEQSLSPVKELRDEELVALTDKEQLKVHTVI